MFDGDSATWLVFLNVLLQQLGLPLPAVPTLMIAGSQVPDSPAMVLLLAAAGIASVVADIAWYFVGRVFGYRVLNGLCRLSINPSSCVTQTEARFVRWGIWSLIFAKFVPGFSTVAPPIAGALRMPLAGFAAAAGAGAVLWAGVALGAGWLLREQVDSAIELLRREGPMAAMVVGGALALWLGWKLWQRYRFRRLSDIPHVSAEELLAALRSDAPPRLLDFRGASLVARGGEIRGATLADLDGVLAVVADWPKSVEIVTLCACPHDATAVHAARTLIAAGWVNSRPLRDGHEAWRLLREDSDAGARGTPAAC